MASAGTRVSRRAVEAEIVTLGADAVVNASDGRIRAALEARDESQTAAVGQSRRARIYTVIALIPRGKVTTYGRVAALAGIPGQARQVGYALAALDADNDVPWHRVINARGEISRRAARADEHRQRELLEGEGVRFGADGRVPLSRYGWPPDS